MGFGPVPNGSENPVLRRNRPVVFRKWYSRRNPLTQVIYPEPCCMAANMPKYSKNSKTILTVLPVIALLLALPVTNVFASNSSSKNFAELVWGDGTLWSLLAPPSPLPHPGASQGQEDFFEEAPQCATSTGPGCPAFGSPASPQSDACDHLGIIPGTSASCSHDHTLGSTPGTPGFRALWHVFLVVCLSNAPSATSGSSSCTAGPVTGVPFGGSSPITLNLAGSVVIDGTATPLTSAAAVQSAEAAGVVSTIDTFVTFICPVQPFSG